MSRIAGSIDSAYGRAKTKRRQRSTDTLGAVLVMPGTRGGDDAAQSKSLVWPTSKARRTCAGATTRTVTGKRQGA
jgi:hypothetical protein